MSRPTNATEMGNAMLTTIDATDPENGEDLQITGVSPKAAGWGKWVDGTLNGRRFNALVFADHAADPTHETGDSRISKLWLQRLAARRAVFHWDRALDV